MYKYDAKIQKNIEKNTNKKILLRKKQKKYCHYTFLEYICKKIHSTKNIRRNMNKKELNLFDNIENNTEFNEVCPF